MSTLRFGLVGCGAISTIFQIPALQRVRRAQLIAVADLDANWAKTVAGKFGVPESYGDYRELVGRVDAVLIATPNTTHADIACFLLEKGIHVLCEKPLATCSADVERMLTAAHAGGARLMAAHCLRFSPNLAKLRELVQAGMVGELQSISAAIGGVYDGGPQRTDFRKTRSLSGGGVLIDVGIHLIDLALWIAGEPPTAIDYHGSSIAGWEVESDVELTLSFPERASASIAASFSRPMDPSFRVTGSEGWVRASLYNPTTLSFFSESARVCQRSGAQQLVLDGTSMYETQIDHFCEATASGAEFVVRDDEMRAGMRVVEQCYASGGAA
jgi:predicted dehydrogenase